MFFWNSNFIACKNSCQELEFEDACAGCLNISHLGV